MDKETNEIIKEIFEMYENMALEPTTLSLIKTLKEWYFEIEKYKSRVVKALKYLDMVEALATVDKVNILSLSQLKQILRGKE